MMSNPLGAVERGPVLLALLDVGRPGPLLEDQLLGVTETRRVGVLEDDAPGVGELLVVVEEGLAPAAGDPGRVGLDAEPQQATSMSCTPARCRCRRSRSRTTSARCWGEGWAGTGPSAVPPKGRNRVDRVASPVLTSRSPLGVGCSRPWPPGPRRSPRPGRARMASRTTAVLRLWVPT